MNTLQKEACTQVSKALVQFATAQEGARKFHAESIGDVDPHYCFGDYLLCVAGDNKPLLEKRYGAYQTKTALSATGGGTTGGYLVPNELRDDLMGDVAEEAIIRKRAVVVPMTTTTLKLPYWDATTATGNGIAPFWGAMQMSWVEETKTLTESEPKQRQLELAVHELGGTLLVSAPLMQDAKGLEVWLRRAFTRSLAWYEDWSFVNGNGAGQPLGLISAPCAVTINRAQGNQYGATDGQKMYGSLYSPSNSDRPVSPSAVWLFSITVKQSRASQTGFTVNLPMTQYGMPIYDTLHQPALGTKGDVIAVDASFYVIGDREALEIAASPYTDGTVFKQNQWMFRVVERIDGQPMLSSAITVPDGGTTKVSPIIVLS